MRRPLLTLALLGAATAALPATAGATGYAIPPDNPFAATPGARGEVYAFGLRNPFRWSFDRATGDMAIGDVGGGAREEVDFLPRAQTAGANLGWNCREGLISGPGGCSVVGAVDPVFDYEHATPNGTAITGGVVVRDPALPSLAGRYLFGDFFPDPFGDQIQKMTLGPGATPTDAGETVASLVAFGEDAAAHVYAVSLDGPVYRLSESAGQLDKSSIGGFDQPMAVAAVPGDPSGLFVVQRGGMLRLREGVATHDFADLSGDVSTDGERGFLAAAAAPDYQASGRVFVLYTDTDGDVRLDVVTRSAGAPTRADPASRRHLLAIEHSSASNHNGGQLQFGPDGYLYMSVGDGGSQGDPEGDALSVGSLLGKVLRLDVADSASATPVPIVDRPDTERPRLGARVPPRQRVLKLQGVVAYVRASEAGRVKAGGKLRIERHMYRLRKAGSRIAAGRRARLVPRLRKPARRALRKALSDGRHPKVVVGLRAIDDAGNVSRLLRRTVRVMR